MKKLRTILVDDEKKAREVIENYLTTYCAEQVEIIAICDGYQSAIEALQKNEIDLLFLDVEMPFGNGLDVLESINHTNFKVVFTTAYDQYAIDAMHAHAFDYLLKPISIKKLVKTVNDAFELQEKASQPTSSKVYDFFKVPSSNGFLVIKQEDIVYAKADDNYCEVYTNNQEKHLVSKTLKRVEMELFPDMFLRIHKSYLVNKNHIKSYEKSLGGNLILSHKIEVPVSHAGKKVLKDIFI